MFPGHSIDCAGLSDRPLELYHFAIASLECSPVLRSMCSSASLHATGSSHFGAKRTWNEAMDASIRR